MEVIADISSLRNFLQPYKLAGKTICLVPTMGNLHAGHLRLVDAARARGDVVVTSLYVNPLQFGPQEDLQSYPRTFEQDKEALEAAGCHCLFAPATEELYPGGLDAQTLVHVPGLTDNYCGASRPGHFDGVTTVVSRLFHIVAPQIAVFGLKDYQQFLVIQKMVTDLALDIELLGVEIVREEDGLAMSSRNHYLDDRERAIASQLYKTLTATAQAISDSDRNFSGLEQQAKHSLEKAGMKPDYFAICDASTLQTPSSDTTSLVILAAAYLGSTRLIDNFRLPLPNDS